MSGGFNTPNALFFPAISTLNLPLATEVWRMATKTSNTYNSYLILDLVFKYTNTNSQFNLTSTSPYDYMTIFHMGTGAASSGIEVCLVRKDSDTNPIQIGLRTATSSSSGWTELTGSFYNLTNLDTNSFMIMLEYNYSGSNTIINFYVSIYNATTTKTAPDFTFTTSSAPAISPISNQWGFGSAPQSIPLANTPSTKYLYGYLATNSYNSYVSQNVTLNFIRTWNPSTLIPPTSTGATTWAMFNTASPAYSLYGLNKSFTQVPAGTANLNFQLAIPTTNLTLGGLSNVGTATTTAVTLGTSTTAFQTLSGFSVNSTSGLNFLAPSDISCLLIGTNILTPNGYVKIEELKIGDEVLTHKGIVKKIKNIKLFPVIGNYDSYPRIIRKGTFNAIEDLYLSSGHAILIDNVFDYPFNLNLEICEKYSILNYYCLAMDDYLNDTLVANGVVVETWGELDITIKKDGTYVPPEYYNEKGLRIYKNL